MIESSIEQVLQAISIGILYINQALKCNENKDL